MDDGTSVVEVLVGNTFEKVCEVRISQYIDNIHHRDRVDWYYQALSIGLFQMSAN